MLLSLTEENNFMMTPENVNLPTIVNNDCLIMLTDIAGKMCASI